MVVEDDRELPRKSDEKSTPFAPNRNARSVRIVEDAVERSFVGRFKDVKSGRKKTALGRRRAIEVKTDVGADLSAQSAP
jgi:hypothetical protein